MADGDEVRSRSVIVHVSVREWTVDGERRYDWITSSGLESDEFYDSADEALIDGMDQLRG